MSHPAVPSRKEASRERILQAAGQAVRRAGFDDLVISDVMREAGLTHGGFYAHFDSRDALLCAAVERAGKDSTAFVEAQTTRLTDSGLTPFRALVETYLSESVITSREQGCPVAVLCSEMPSQAAEVVSASRQLVRDLHRLVKKALHAERPTDTAWAVASAIIGAMQLARALGDNEEGRAALAAAKRDILRRYEARTQQ